MARQRSQDERRVEHRLSSYLRARGGPDSNEEEPPILKKHPDLPNFLRDNSERESTCIESIESTILNGLIGESFVSHGSTSNSSDGQKKISPLISFSDSDDASLYDSLSEVSE